ncbi:FAD/NAD(P)-binding protein [Modestobacter sp. NPDC049651]|uniref:FAD/NAD(P)-binding protein n=1 Tax=unclassified Modestobacter TaxID=2643866 RepID=UPI003401E3D7
MTAVAAEPGTGPVTVAHDLLFVGAGASTSYVLLELLAGLGDRPPARPLRIAVVERAPDAFSGTPYGSRSARTSLLITPLRDFLPDPERSRFTGWLAANKHWVFDEHRAAAGPLAARWWDRHRTQVERDEFDPLYLPRYTFGEYLRQRTRAAIEQAAAAGVATTDVLQDDVRAVDAVRGGYRVRCRERTLTARRVVLAAGSPPVGSRLPAQDELPGAVLVDDPFDDMTAAVRRIGAALAARTAHGPAHVVLIGGNAGTMDMLYQLNDLDLPAARTALFTVLSPGGRLPERIDDGHVPAPFAADRLQALTTAAAVDAVTVYEAALADIARGRRAGLTTTDTLRPVSAAVGALLPRLAPDQAAEFAARWGTELGRHQRRAGWEYCEVTEQLAIEGRLRLVPAAYVGVRADADGTVHVQCEQAGRAEELTPAADVVVNCGGPARPVPLAAAPLLDQLVTDGVCRPTAAGAGVAVDDALAAAPGLHVMGPLLAGNVVKGSPVWHMEHCGRISTYGTALGADLARSLSTGGR